MLNVSPPRVCGDYNSIKMNNDTTPRMRGLPSIPILSTKTIQPRVCGDYVVASFALMCGFDTTPRMRGLPAIQSIKHVRYNPAYAGTTCTSSEDTGAGPIQPRVCGDYFLLHKHEQNCNDTTPRMRGLRKKRKRQRPRHRYNPAYAGTTTRAGAGCTG